MTRFFAKLNKRTVRIPLADGEWIDAPLLPISEIGEMDEISRMLEKLNRDNAREIAERMVNLALKSLPEYGEALRRFQLDELAELLALLMYGTNEPDDGEQEQKKEEDGEKKA